MPIHQARHEGSATAIDHDGVLPTIRGHDRSDACDPAPFDENLACRRRSNIAGPDCAVGEQKPPYILFHGFPPLNLWLDLHGAMGCRTTPDDQALIAEPTHLP